MENLIIETPDFRKANELYNSQEWSKPVYDNDRHLYICIKKAKYKGV